MPLSSSSEAAFTFRISAAHNLETAVVEFSVTEEMSRPFQVAVSLASENAMAASDVIGQPALLTVVGENTRHFHGVISQFAFAGIKGRFRTYQALVVPELWRLGLKQDCRIFQNQTLEQIIGTILQEAGITRDRYEFRLQHKGQLLKYAVQYRETDFSFISRLLEEAGIFHYYEHFPDRHLLVFGDGAFAHKPIHGDRTVAFKRFNGLELYSGSIHSFSFSRSLCPDSYAHTDYDYHHPSFDLTTSRQRDGTSSSGEIYEYPGRYLDAERGKHLARIRLEELNALREKGEGSSSCARMAPGFTFTLTDHDSAALNGDYLLTVVKHTGMQPQATEERQSAEPALYRNEFSVIPASVPYRPERVTPRGVVRGLQTAVVVGPPGERIHTDRYGRVRVQFHWDRKGGLNEKSSCWLRCAQRWAGDRRGMLFTPRVGDEVLVDFLEGDPDRPIIINSVYNEANLPLYELPGNKSVSTIKSGSCPSDSGFNELRFEDQKGSEEIYLHAQKDCRVEIGHDKNQTVGRDETLQVGNDRVKFVGIDQNMIIGHNHSESIGKDKDVRIERNSLERVAINSLETVGAAKELTVGGLYQVCVGGAINETVIGAKAEEAGTVKTVNVRGNLFEKVMESKESHIGSDFKSAVYGDNSVRAGSIVFAGGSDIVFRTGRAMLAVKSDGEIVILGGNVVMKAEGEVKVTGKSIRKESDMSSKNT